MSIKEVMTYGCDGLNDVEREAEQARRISVVERINKIGKKIANCPEDEKAHKRRLLKQLQTIKAEENVWLKKAAWFMYY